MADRLVTLLPKTIILSQMDKACFTVLATLQDRGRGRGGGRGAGRSGGPLANLPPSLFWVGVLSTRKPVEQRGGDTAVHGHLPDLPVSLCLIFIFCLISSSFF